MNHNFLNLNHWKLRLSKIFPEKIFRPELLYDTLVIQEEEFIST
ncbi:unnamed protein product [Paramecium sonneborni]|uniref:Uncharacterized protein n=1 Tax=Paramecium sonneborni TaxID=65129 RepID=A0A8S1MU92_9CILI|nr:unnamed protein product [Paramecium sonneborni]